MSLLGLELSDAGIMVAAADPARLLTVDGHGTESPGFALPEKKRLTVGSTAERKAHLYPRQIIDRFWDQLNTEPLEQPNPYAQNHAEIACEHLARIWKTVNDHGNELVITVPGFFNQNHMGLILGISRELSIPVKGFVAQAVASAPNALPEGLLLHLDIHLHRSEVTCLKRQDRLIQKDSLSLEGSGISRLYKDWVNTIAEEFVRSTRFDPLHQAASEQELYNRLPIVLEQLKHRPTVIFEMTGGSNTYHVNLTQELFLQKSEPVFREIGRLIDRMREQYEKNEPTVVLQLTHRLTRLPGVNEALSEKDGCLVIELEPGTGALGALQFRDQLSSQPVGQGAPFLTSRPLPAISQTHVSPPQPQPKEKVRPTHLLYRDLAYPITEQPLFIGLEAAVDASGILIQGQIAGVSRKHCSVQLQEQGVVLEDFSAYGTFVDADRVTGSAVLQLGQVIRVGTPGETLLLIACLDTDETQKSNDI